MNLMRVFTGVCVTLLTLACQSTGAAVPAALERADAQTMAAVKAVLADAVGRARIELGPGDLTTSSTISVLPPPLSPEEGRSTATPIVFDLVIKGSSCYAVRRDTGRDYALAGVSCRPLSG